MKICCILSKDYLDLAKAEVDALASTTSVSLATDLVELTISKKEVDSLSSRCALVKSIHSVLFSCSITELEHQLSTFDWEKIYQGSFSVDVNKEKNSCFCLKEREIASFVWKKVSKPKIDLKCAKTPIVIVVRKDICVVTLLLHNVKQDFMSRRSHLLPFFHSGAIHPKLARACVNILGIRKDKTILDPFCGAGGFLIEAGLMGLKATGSDLNEKMVWGCMQNLDHFKIKHYDISVHDALQLQKKVPYVVSDVPYGLNSIGVGKEQLTLKHKKSSVKDIELFYLKFLENLRRALRKKAVIIFPDFVSYKKILKTSGFMIEKEFSVYIHRSLTRKIVLIS